MRLQALSALKNIDIDLPLCQSVIGENFGDLKIQKVTLDQIITYVSKKQDIKKRLLLGKVRRQEVALARQIIMFLGRDLTGLSLKNIGLSIGKRDHSTVIHACKIIEDKIKVSSAFNKLIKEYTKDLKKYSIS